MMTEAALRQKRGGTADIADHGPLPKCARDHGEQGRSSADERAPRSEAPPGSKNQRFSGQKSGPEHGPADEEPSEGNAPHCRRQPFGETRREVFARGLSEDAVQPEHVEKPCSAEDARESMRQVSVTIKDAPCADSQEKRDPIDPSWWRGRSGRRRRGLSGKMEHRHSAAEKEDTLPQQKGPVGAGDVQPSHGRCGGA